MKSLEIFGDIFGAIGDNNQWSNFVCVNENGMLNINKYSEYMRLFANMGSNYTREIPFLTVDKNYSGNVIQRNIQPFRFFDGLYSLSEFNEQYFINLKEMIKASHRHNMGFQVVFFDRCHSLLPESCWMKNHQNIKGWYDWNVYAENYVKKILTTANDARIELYNEGYKDFKIMFELENEPLDEGFLVSGYETLKLIKESGYDDNQIEWGVFHIDNKVEYNAKGELITTPLRRKFKDKLCDLGIYTEESKKEFYRTLHDFGNNQKKLDEIQNMIQYNWKYHYSFSNDGQKPKADFDWWYDTMLPIFEAMKERGKTFNWKFEALYRGDLSGNSMFNDSMTGLMGLSAAYNKVFGYYPENYGNFPETIYPPLPEPETIEPVKPTEPPIIIIKPEKEIKMIEKIKKWVDENKWYVLGGTHLLALIIGAILF